MLNRLMSLAVGALVGVLVVGCGNNKVTATSASVGHQSPESDVETEYQGNPGDIVALSNFGSADHMLVYDSYEQMRDFSDSVVLARFRSFDVVVEPSVDATLSGISLLRFSIVEIVSGREAPELSDGQLVVTLPLGVC